MDHINDKDFQVSVKGLFFQDNKLMLMQEANGVWEPPGGRVQAGEDLLDSLKRECREEMGLECQILEKHPSIVYSALDRHGHPRIMLFYKIHLDNLDFIPSEECTDIKFFTKDEMRKLKMMPQIKKLPDFLI